MKKYIIAIDEGTTSERVVLYDIKKNKIIDAVGDKLKQYYPHPGYVEHDAEEIFEKVNSSLETILKTHKIMLDEIAGIGITNQRETTVAWNKQTGKPIYHAICWQCKRTADFCDKISKQMKQKIKTKTGLVVDSYFSATKMKWFLNNVSESKKLLKENNLAFGTIDTYLIYRLTNGSVFATDTTNASRTMLVDISNPTEFDDELTKFFSIPKSCLPEIKNSADNFGFAKTSIGDIPILAVIGDQQSSLVGQGCFDYGMAKMTYGTGGFLLINSGNKLKVENEKSLNTVAYTINNKTTYAIEGSIFNVGSCLEYLKNELGLFESYKDIDKICQTEDSSTLNFLPAFSGIGVPYWSQSAKATIGGLTLGTTKGAILKSAVESFALILHEIFSYLKKIGIELNEMSVDGGVSKNDYLLEFQSNVLQVPVKRCLESESTSLGAIFLAGLQANEFKSFDEIKSKVFYSKTFTPTKNYKELLPQISNWQKFVNNNI